MKARETTRLGILVGLLGAAAAGCAGQPDDPTDESALGVATRGDGTEYLTDGAGRALYLLEGESEGRTTCEDGCTEVWPPFLAPNGTPQVPTGTLRAELVGTAARGDGTTQVTYAGHPLYYFQEDEGPGDVRGQDRTDPWGDWYLIAPSGDPVEEHPEEAVPPTP